MKNKKKTYKIKKGFVNSKIKEKLNKIQHNINRNSMVYFTSMRYINNDQIINEKLEKANVNMDPKKSKKKRIFNICFFIFNILLVALVFYNFAKEQGGIQPLSTLLSKNPKWTFIFIAIGLYIATVLFNTCKFSILIKNKTGRFRPWFSFKLASIGKYYDNVTPLGSGGQPFEIYYLKKNGYSGDTSTAIPLAKYMAWQVSFVLFSFVILILNTQNYLSSPLVLILAWIGIAINLALFLFVFFMSITKKWGASLVVGVLKLLYKMKIIKNYRRVLIKVLKFVKSYQFCIKSFAKSPLTVISEVIVSLASIISNALIAFFILKAFTADPQITWWEIVCSCCICEAASCFVPLPGGSGAQELSFNALLGALFPAGTLFWGVLIWRFLTYYLHILQGGIVLIGDFIAGRIHSHKKTTILSTNIETADGMSPPID